MREVNQTNSLVAINNGNGDFTTYNLPKEVQFSSVKAICAIDVNNDSNLDLVLGGNEYGYKPQYSRLDANYGSVLIGDGKGQFEWQEYAASGFFVKGEVKNISLLRILDELHILIGLMINNHGFLR